MAQYLLKHRDNFNFITDTYEPIYLLFELLKWGNEKCQLQYIISNIKHHNCKQI